MLVELVGLPGSGKSTLVRALVPRLRSAGVSARRADKMAGLASADPDAPRYLKRGLDRTTLYRSLAFRRDNAALMDHVERQLALSPEAEFLFSLTTVLYQACREHEGSIDVAFLDEGFTHRGVSAHLQADDAQFDAYMRLIPPPDLTIHLCPPPRMAFRRAIHRRADRSFSKRKVQAKLGDKFVFRRRHRLLEIGLEVLKARGAQVIDVNTALEVDTCVEAIMPRILAACTAAGVPRAAAE